MKIKALVVALFVAGLAASLALASPQKRGDTTASTSTTTTTGKKPKCFQVELKGTANAGSLGFVVTKANKRGRDLVGKTVVLAVPAGAKVKAKACTSAGSSALTLRELHVQQKQSK
jgi:hypothetical protein